jgi:hypothetical protein
MTILITIGIFLLPIFSGAMFVHLLWPERDGKILLFKFFLGSGLGLGIFSLLYFLYLFPFAGRHGFIFIELAVFLILLALTIWKEKSSIKFSLPKFNLTRAQIIFSAIAAIVFSISLLGTASYLLRHQQGDWDAWMMFNRAARFTFRDQTHWLESFSRQMDPIFHADYPLLLAMNISSGWDTLGAESARIPMVESALFAIVLMGILVSALASIKSIAQAALGLIIFWGTPVMVSEGSRELADVPLAFFMLATVLLIYFFVIYKKPQLLILAGLSAGLAAWTKNEGTLFVVGVLAALVIAFFFDTNIQSIEEIKNKNFAPLRLRVLNFLPVLFQFILGLAFPLIIVAAFKIFLAPPSDVLRGTETAAQKIMTLSRHLEILQHFRNMFLHFGGWMVGVLPVLVIYFLLFHSPIDKTLRTAFIAGLAILAIQILGDYAVYLITPYDLAWHLNYSLQRIFAQVYPIIVFLILSSTQNPEEIFHNNTSNKNGNNWSL